MKLLKITAFALSVGLTSGASAEDVPVRLELACGGAGSANRADHTTVNAYGNGGYASANIVGRRSEGFSDQVNLWVEANDGRIRMPRTMLPPIRGGEDGWFKLKSIKLTDREITASVAVNALNNPKLRIDRFSGAISLSGKAGNYSGHCVKYDPSTEARAF